MDVVSRGWNSARNHNGPEFIITRWEQGKLISENQFAGKPSMTASDIIQLVESVNSMEKSFDSVSRDVRRLSRLFGLRAGPGRPRHREITLATKMRREGKPWPEIYKSCPEIYKSCPDRGKFASAGAYREAERNLRKAVAQRLKRDITPPGRERVSSRQTIPPIQ